ncbi:MATE family efflux transporter [Solibaculum mannosilyticum]|uniref:Multidrug export protein MepA n=1 Tax=Solibaculum mannosilyticum TaxID=2780922 RepID=A0A7I8D3F3_9FIRM|nr:MATE family efflux transporter [Solibaculum mannosilyticum]BCI59753.1 multidrug transporter MatE [Solibaculum mannosilyticum]
MSETTKQLGSEADRNPLGTAPVGKLLLQFALPSVVAMLVNSLYNIVDQVFIGNGVGYLGIGATTIAFTITIISLSIALLIGNGGSALAAIRLGENKKEEAERILGNSFVLLVASSVIFAVLGLIFLEPMLRFFGSSDNILPYAVDYSSVILIGIPFVTVGTGLNNFIRTDGSPKMAMISMLVGAVLNTILDPIFIFPLQMGVRGAAIATVISQVVSLAVTFYYFARKSNMKLRVRTMRVKWNLTRSLIAIGISSCVTQLGNMILQIVLNNSLGYYGDLAGIGADITIPAMGIVFKLNGILISILVGISAGAQPILGFNKGAKHYHRIRKTYLLEAVMATIVAILGWLFAICVPDLAVSLFGGGDAAFTEFAAKCMRIFLLGVFCSGFQIVSANYFQATGQPLKATILSMSRQILLLIPLILILPTFLGLEGILYAGPVADVLAAVVVSFFIVHELRHLGRKAQTQKAQLEQQEQAG